MSTLPGFALVVLLLSAGSAGAESLVLKRDAELSDAAVAGPEAPLFLMADCIESSTPGIVEASGRVEARQAGQNFFADWLLYDTTLNEVQARGQVRLEQPVLWVGGDSLRLNLNDYSGELTQPVYRFTTQPGRGAANRIDFLDKTHYALQDATYTTCPVDNDDW
ncbi:MAG: LPS-assembly protein LptD, partial [Thiobacillus sp.]